MRAADAPETDRVAVRSFADGVAEVRDDDLAVEEPLLIRIRRRRDEIGFPFVTTMRTPGRDDELAAGLLFAEGVVESRRDILGLARPDHAALSDEQRANGIIATLAEASVERAEKLHRGSVMGSACGVCGKTTIDAVLPRDRPPVASRILVSTGALYRLPEGLRSRQSVFAATGGLHAAGLASAEGDVAEVREDIGRHNATDKVIGSRLLGDALPASDAILTVSGRAGFEIVQKAFSAGIPVVASVSAPSSLAVALADEAGITLVGFLRGRRFNAYTHPERIVG